MLIIQDISGFNRQMAGVYSTSENKKKMFYLYKLYTNIKTDQGFSITQNMENVFILYTCSHHIYYTWIWYLFNFKTTVTFEKTNC